jgi:hypothetical protein
MKRSDDVRSEAVRAPSRPDRAGEVDVSPERIRALVAGRVPHALLLDLGPAGPTSAQILREEKLGE